MRSPQRTVGILTTMLLTGTAASACGGSDSHEDPAPSVTASITVHSPDIRAGASIPRRYTCDGSGEVPRLRWSGVPKGAKALAVLVDDGDAPAGPYVHWLVLDLPATTTSLGSRVPAPAHQAGDSAGKPGWTPPCPPNGDGAHHYRFTVYALRAATRLPNGVDDARAKKAIDDLAVGRGQLVATYKRRP
ncbi:MAG: YbhB/YbcL family Raf kinase inhibitor-like protein [Streptosporangiales bacterium]|nr:YbhB/YbcL family Raf kinase inhibitor-like protein [Streptosporangiales bacterium]MBO0892564.1 YbhB/YbcL family Raf kinase inhibitor-like protein [Acidothermales bacterium]